MTKRKYITPAPVQNEVLNQFYIEVLLIEPVSEILAKLNENKFRDCDIKFLNTKLETFIQFTCQTLGITAPITDSVCSSFTMLNEYAKSKYIEYFSTLLAYFKNL